MAAAFVALMVIGFLLVGCLGPWKSTPLPEPHDAYRYGKFSSVDPGKDYHPGDEVAFTWEATPKGTVYAEEADEITLRASLYGPFDTVEKLKEAMSSTRTPGQTPGADMTGAAVRIDPVKTDSWTNRTYTSSMKLPATLEPGFYSMAR